MKRAPTYTPWRYLVLAGLICWLQAYTPAYAGDGHDHGDTPAASDGNAPRRQADGSVFLPKTTQRQFGLRTLPAEVADLPRTFELAGTVVMDPNAGGKVQAALAGRLEAGAQGFAAVGQAVRKGQVLAYVVPSAGAIERSNQVAQQAELRASQALAQRRLARLRELADTVPRKEIEAAASELASLGARLAAVSAGLSGRDVLVAPVSGVIASANATAGQVVDARELVFEVVDPARLRIEALAYDMAQAQDIAGAHVAVGDSAVALRFLGAGRSLRAQALPLWFAGDAQALSQLAVGQPVRVFAQSKATLRGIRVPAASVLKNASNQSIVWIKQAPERFVPVVVTATALDGATVAITQGLDAGQRVVTDGAALLHQIR